MNAQKNKKISKTSLLVFSVLFILAVLTLISVHSNTVALAELQKTEQNLNMSIENELKEKEELEKSEEYYKSDEYIEKAAREKLGYVKPNEIVFIPK